MVSPWRTFMMTWWTSMAQSLSSAAPWWHCYSICSGAWGGIIISLPVLDTTVHDNSRSSSSATMDTIVLAAALEAGKSYLYPYLRQRYIIIPHLQAPLQIGARTSQWRQNRKIFYDIGRGAWRSGIFMYRHLRYRYRYDYTTSNADTTNFPRLLKSTKRSQEIPIR